MNAAPRPSSRLQRRIASAFTERLALKSTAVLLALALWFVVGTREPREEYAPVRFAPLMDSALVLRDPPPAITAHVMGRPSEILKLANTPLVIRRPVAGDVPDTLTLALRASDVEVPENVEIIVREVYPQSLTLRFEPTARRRVPVRSSLLVRMPVGTPPVTVRLDPDSVTVFGPRRSVAAVGFVPTVADSIPLDTQVHLVDLDTAGLGLSRVSVRPFQVKAWFGRARP